MKNNWKNKNILIIGAARQGLALARYLAEHQANITLADRKSQEQLETAIKSLSDLTINWVLGEHQSNLLDDKDLVCISGGVPADLPILQEACERGISLSNDSQIFIENAPCKVIGITGSAGKTTTTTLVGKMAEAAKKNTKDNAWVGGNIGNPLVANLDQIQKEDLAVMELSSFQLELMNRSPQISAILNVTPNHLDRHGTLDQYAEIKANVFRHQKAENTLVLGKNDPKAWSYAEEAKGDLLSFGFNRPSTSQKGTFCENEKLLYWNGTKDIEIMPRELIELRGEHNLLNVLAACALAFAAGLPVSAMQDAVRGFGGVPHRLEFIREYKGSKWYNDSKATTPAGSYAAINSFEEPMIVLLGGKDKKLPWDQLADLVNQKVKHLIAFGEAADIVLQAMDDLDGEIKVKSQTKCSGLEEAIQTAAGFAQSGQIVLLAPGGTSFDEFNNYEERGEAFRAMVKRL